MNKKISTLSLALLTATSALNSNPHPQESHVAHAINHPNVKLINDSFMEFPTYYIPIIQKSGGAASHILSELGTYDSLEKNKTTIINSINNKKLLSALNDADRIAVLGTLSAITDEHNAYECEKALIDAYKKNFFEEREKFLGMLYQFKFLLRPIIHEVVSRDPQTKPDASLLLKFLDSDGNKAHAFFYDNIKNAQELRQVGREFTALCCDLWKSMTHAVKLAYKKKKAEETKEAEAASAAAAVAAANASAATQQ
jgi:hypothetical protein